jgi:hypothetical protein
MLSTNRIDGLSDSNDTRKLEGRKFSSFVKLKKYKWNFLIENNIQFYDRETEDRIDCFAVNVQNTEFQAPNTVLRLGKTDNLEI